MFVDQATNSEIYSIRYVRFSPFFGSGLLLEAIKFPKIVQKMPFLTSKPGDGLFLKHGLLLR